MGVLSITGSLRRLRLLSLSLILIGIQAEAQLSTNKDKFLGNITTYGGVNPSGFNYKSLWNQITPENETKWSSCQSNQNSFNFNTAAYDYAKANNIKFKFHTLMWGSQYPSFMDGLSTSEQYQAIVKWFDAAKSQYPDLEIIDVVNEAIAGHAPAPFKNALGGDGKTGFDWIIKAFEMAHERWPNAILIYNDYNTFQHQKQQFIDLVRTLRDAGAPIDAYGCQSHDLNDMSKTGFENAMNEIQSELKMPMYITEYDINKESDEEQLTRFQEQIPVMWEADYCAGVTIWGFIYGSTWVDHSGLYKNGQERPAMTWLKNYMATDKAKNAKSPFPGMKKEASVYIKPASLFATKGEAHSINILASMRTKTIDSIDLYVNNTLYATLKESPYTVDYVPQATGTYNLKAMVYTTDGSMYERYSSFNAYNQRQIFGTDTISLPGTFEAENFDIGGDGLTYHDSNSDKEGDAKSYRSDGGIDIVTGNGGHALGYTNSGEWMEYTVNVAKEGYYNIEVIAASGTTNSSFQLYTGNDNGMTEITPVLSVPKTGNDWSVYTTMIERTSVPLKAGPQTIRLAITGSSCNIDKITFNHVPAIDKNLNLSVSVNPSPATINKETKFSFATKDALKYKQLAGVRVYINGALLVNLEERPFRTSYTPTQKGSFILTAIGKDTDGRESEVLKTTIKVNGIRTPYSGSAISIPGTIEVENFDKGGQDFTFYDSDTNDEGNANYRNDNEGVDIVASNGGYVLGYTAGDEWAEYTVNVTNAGTYSLQATVSSGIDNSGFRVGLMSNKSEQKLAEISVPNTGDWDTYVTQTVNDIELSAGTQVIRLTITGPYCNIDNIMFNLQTGIDDIRNDKGYERPRYNLNGMEIDANYQGIIITDGKKTLNR